MPRASRTSTRGAAAAAATPPPAGASASASPPLPAAPRSATRSSARRDIKPDVKPNVKPEPPSTPSPSKKTPASTPASQAKAAEKKIASLRASLDEGPFPAWPRPTPQDCHEVAQLLADAHGYRAIPTGKKAQKKEESFGGCGNVANVLDALIRTVLSCNTSSRNSTAAHKAMVEAYGKNNFQALLDAPHAELAATIRCGGLHDRKAGIIQGILSRTLELHGKLSLDHLHGAPSRQVMEELVAFNGVGPKVASCCSAFCIGNDEMAVDTHVWRLCKALGWVPEKATRDQTYYHLSSRVPDDLKYGLHVLLISHGKRCPNCSAKGFATVKDEIRTPSTSPEPATKQENGVKAEPGVKKEEAESGDEESETKDARALRDGRPALDGCALRKAGLLSKGKARKVKAEAKQEAKEEEDEEKLDPEGALKRESSVGAAGERRSKRTRKSQA